MLTKRESSKNNISSWTKLIDLKTKNIQLRDAKIEFFIKFYEQYNFLEKYEIAFIVYDGEDFFSVISFYEIRSFYTQEELDYYLLYECFRGWKENIDDEVQDIFEKYPRIRLILAERPQKSRNQYQFICKYPITDKTERCKNILSLRNVLRAKGIGTYYVKIPAEREIIQHSPFFYCFSDAFLWTDYMEEKVREILPLITSKSYEESKGWVKRKKWISSVGDGRRKIYLAGPCIVNGDEVFTEDELAVLLLETIEQENFNCEVIKVCRPWFQYETFCEEILEFDICKNDIVIFLDEALEEYDLDLTKAFRNYSGNDWLYLDVPIHTTRKGNELIVSELMENIILPEYKKNCLQDDDIVLQYGKRQLNSREKEGIEYFLKEIDNQVPSHSGKKDVAAIVMTGNPFTYGHQYLVEWGSRNSDELYIFVVQEDAFLFSYKERTALIEAGTSHLKNVFILPGGKFLATKNTFRNYYEREKTDEREVDASKDIFFFSEYIAPHLHIKKRFVGEEPLDKVTAQYNRQLKENLPGYGIEVIEIPRKEYKNHVISASWVRQCIEAGEYCRIQSLVPRSTYKYIKEHLEQLQVKLKVKEKFFLSNSGRKYLRTVENFIEQHSYVVMYGIGVNAQKFVGLLSREYVKKVRFCDQRAGKELIYFCGEKVMEPAKLYHTDRNAHVLVMTHIYRREVYLELREKGIPKGNIMCVVNWIELYKEKSRL